MSARIPELLRGIHRTELDMIAHRELGRTLTDTEWKFVQVALDILLPKTLTTYIKAAPGAAQRIKEQETQEARSR